MTYMCRYMYVVQYICIVSYVHTKPYIVQFTSICLLLNPWIFFCKSTDLCNFIKLNAQKTCLSSMLPYHSWVSIKKMLLRVTSWSPCDDLTLLHFIRIFTICIRKGQNCLRCTLHNEGNRANSNKQNDDDDDEWW